MRVQTSLEISVQTRPSSQNQTGQPITCRSLDMHTYVLQRITEWLPIHRAHAENGHKTSFDSLPLNFPIPLSKSDISRNFVGSVHTSLLGIDGRND